MAGADDVLNTVTGDEYVPFSCLSGERISEPIKNRPASTANPTTYLLALVTKFSLLKFPNSKSLLMPFYALLTHFGASVLSRSMRRRRTAIKWTAPAPRQLLSNQR